MHIHELKDLIDHYIEQCDEAGIEPELKVVTQKNWPLTAKISGSAINDGKLVLAVEATSGYAQSADRPAFSDNFAIAWLHGTNNYEDELGYHGLGPDDDEL